MINNLQYDCRGLLYEIRKYPLLLINTEVVMNQMFKDFISCIEIKSFLHINMEYKGFGENIS